MESKDNYIATAAIRLNKRKLLKKTQNYSTVLSIYFRGSKVEYTTSVQCTEMEWERLTKNKNIKDPTLKDKRDRIAEIQSKANKLINKLGKNFSFESFECLYFGIKAKAVKNKQDVYAAMQEYELSLKSNGQVGTAQTYHDAVISLKKFRPKLNFVDVTVAFLTKYEQSMIAKGKSPSTIGIYLRNLRTIMNVARTNKIIPQDMYPFGAARKGLYEIPTSRKNKRALDEGMIKAILNFIPRTESEAKALAFWQFSFFCNGLNMCDIFNLKYSNLQGDCLSLYRSKTVRTRKVQQPIEIYITPVIRAIIDKYGNSDRKSDNYIFDVYKKGDTCERKFQLRKLMIRFINDHMEIIGNELGVKIKTTTYVARHSWATILIHKGVPTAFVSIGLGHASLTTTANYLSDFTETQKKNVGQMLMDIKI